MRFIRLFLKPQDNGSPNTKFTTTFLQHCPASWNKQKMMVLKFIFKSHCKLSDN